MGMAMRRCLIASTVFGGAMRRERSLSCANCPVAVPSSEHFLKTPIKIGGGGGSRTPVLGRITSRDYMLSPGIFVGYGMAPELDTHCLVRMKFSRLLARGLRLQPCLQMAFNQRSRCPLVNVAVV